MLSPMKWASFGIAATVQCVLFLGLVVAVLVALFYDSRLYYGIDSVACCFLGRLPTHHGYDPTENRAVAEQTRRSSCGVCCAAKLLRHHGIETTEEELIGPCLTSYRGSPALGLYRGLRLKTSGTSWDVEVVTCTVDELVKKEGPLLLRALLPAAGEITPMGALRTSKRRFEDAVLLIGAEEDLSILHLNQHGLDDSLQWYDRAVNRRGSAGPSAPISSNHPAIQLTE